MACGIWDLSGQLKHNFCVDGGRLRTNDLAVSPDGQRLVVITESSIIVFDLVSYEKIAEFQLDDVKLTSIMISQDSRHMLISMSPDQIKLMEIDTGDVIQRFEAHMQKQFIIRSAFGGADENFVVSGSEGMSLITPSRVVRKVPESSLQMSGRTLRDLPKTSLRQHAAKASALLHCTPFAARESPILRTSLY
jgi:WD40 repeat protein